MFSVGLGLCEIYSIAHSLRAQWGGFAGDRLDLPDINLRLKLKAAPAALSDA